MAQLERIIHRFNIWLSWLSGIALMMLVLLTCANILARPFGYSIKGTFEIVGFLGALVICFALGYTQIRKGYITVEIFISKLPERYVTILQAIFHFISSIVVFLAAWQAAKFATDIWNSGQLSDTLRIPFFPMIYALSVGFAGLTLVLLMDFLKSLKRIINK